MFIGYKTVSSLYNFGFSENFIIALDLLSSKSKIFHIA